MMGIILLQININSLMKISDPDTIKISIIISDLQRFEIGIEQ